VGDRKVDDDVIGETLLWELRHGYGRPVLTFFTEVDTNTVHLDELVEYISERDATNPDLEEIVIELHHRALPALAEAEVIDYDWETNVVRYREGPRLENALSLLRK